MNTCKEEYAPFFSHHTSWLSSCTPFCPPTLLPLSPCLIISATHTRTQKHQTQPPAILYHMTIPLRVLITTLLIAPIAGLPRPPMPSSSQQCLYVTAEHIDTIGFHLETEMMCRRRYRRSDQKRINKTSTKKKRKKKQLMEVWWDVSGVGNGGGVVRDVSRKRLATALISGAKYKQKQYSSI